MRSAPPVTYPVGRFVWGRYGQWPMAGLGLALAVVVLSPWPAWSWRDGLLIGLWAACVALAGWLWPREVLQRGALVWDGRHWMLAVGDQRLAVDLSLCWDAGPGLLLRLGLPARRLPRYAWLQASVQPQDWHALRCAVHARDTL